MEKARCIRYKLHVNRVQRRFLLHHIYEVQRIYQNVSKQLQSNRKYTKEDIYALLKVRHRYYLKQMNEIEIQDLTLAILRCSRHPKGIREYHCLIGNKELIFRGVGLGSLSKVPLKHSRDDACFARLRYTKHQFILYLYIKKSYKNDEKAG
ncbi:hypothetical protein ACWG0P_13535 [Amedibacillus sp. YH-ame6]